MESKPEIESSLRHEIEALRHRLSEAEDILRAIQGDQVDAVVVYTSRGDQIFSLRPQHEDHPYRLFVEKMQEGTIVLAADGTILYSNQYFSQLAGVPLERVTGTSIFDYFDEAERAALHTMLATCGEGNMRGEFQMTGGDEPLPVYLSASRYEMEGEAGACLVVTDRREQKRIESMTEKLRHSERLASIGTLATGIAHEINNPLNSILLSAQYALHAATSIESEVRECLRTIVDETQRCGKIVRNVLQFARQEDTLKAPHDLNATLRRAGQLGHSYVLGGLLELSFELEADLPAVVLNPVEIEQVLLNLIRNACDAARGACKVLVTSRRAGNEAEFSVIDNGPGISPEHVRRIFDPFFSTRRERGGTGLGLSIVHGIVHKHGGSIDVSSEPGVGTTFTIRLPLAPAGGVAPELPRMGAVSIEPQTHTPAPSWRNPGRMAT